MFEILLQGGVTLYVLILCSLATITVCLERTLRLRKAGGDTLLFLSKLTRYLKDNRLDEAVGLCERSHSAVAAVAGAGLAKFGRSKEEIRDTLVSAIATQSHLLGRNLAVLATLATTTPYIGLFGTVLGIIRAFHDISVSGSAGAQVVSRGISEALICTAAGLGVAIVAVFAYNFFQNWLSRFELDFEVVSSEVLHAMTGEEVVTPGREGGR
jgi:biopolymer transport protein ExbB/TolQ